jgi:hypothetical protein
LHLKQLNKQGTHFMLLLSAILFNHTAQITDVTHY